MNNSNAVEITISDVRAFKSCQYLWDFSSTMRRSLRKKFRGFHFTFGDLIHQALAEYYMGNEPDIFFSEKANELLKTIDRNVPGFDKIQDLLIAGPKILRLYAQYAEKYDDFKVVRSEERHQLKLNNTIPGIYFSFKFDAIVERNGENWLLEFKTASSLPSNVDTLVIDDQAVAYQAAAEKVLGFPIHGVIYRFIKKKNPTRPELLKNGQVSKRENIVTTVEEYVDTLVQHSLSPDDYEQFLKYIEVKQFNDFIYSGAVTATAKQKADKLSELAYIGEQMAKIERIYPTPEKTKCGICDFLEPCLARHAGANYEFILDHDYELAEPRL